MCVRMCVSSLYVCLFVLHPAESHSSSVCVKQEPLEASLAPFTPSSLAGSGLAHHQPFQPTVSVDASTPCYTAYARNGPSYGQYASQPILAGTPLLKPEVLFRARLPCSGTPLPIDRSKVRVSREIPKRTQFPVPYCTLALVCWLKACVL